ncbi:hypothetical protein [Nocardioides speluncae]|uniref:hypothetical protein n=1 Tax=Nocardioides speluncae TaxID=2670337 RepID=UPI00197F41F4|nr:hypothetical protein [Nocardioides speluncae]
MRKPTTRISVATGTILALTATLVGGSPTAAAERKQDPNEIWPQERLGLNARVGPCDPAGPSAADGEIANQLNPQLQNKMAGHLNAYRISCARTVIQTVRARGFNPRAAAIAIATVIVESSIDNLYDAVDHDSVGLFQQRPSVGEWGTVEQCRDAVYATGSFLRAMERFYPNGSWNTAPIGEVAADVQRPADQYRYRYAVEANDAIKIVDRLWNVGMGRPSSSQESGRVVSAQSADGRLETFAAGADGVWHAWQTRVNGEWSRWELIGGPKNAQLAIAPSADGRLELFAINGQTFNHIWQTAPSAGWSGWHNFGGGGTDVAAGFNADGRIEVFASGPDGIFHRYQAPVDGGWSGWEGTGGGPANAQLAIESAPDGRLEVFALSGSTFEHKWQTAPNGGWSGWTGFGTGGRDLTVDRNADGRLEVFASNANGVFHKYQTGASSWSGWEGTGPAGSNGLSNGPANAELTSDRSPDGRVEVFAINGSTAAHSWQTNPNAPYSAWETFGTGGTEITATHNRDGRIEVIATSGSGVFHKWQTGATSWSDWAWLNDAGPGIS